MAVQFKDRTPGRPIIVECGRIRKNNFRVIRAGRPFVGQGRPTFERTGIATTPALPHKQRDSWKIRPGHEMARLVKWDVPK
jgi:hypothetical protein